MKLSGAEKLEAEELEPLTAQAATGESTCGQCEHFKHTRTDPATKREQVGDCMESPPQGVGVLAGMRPSIAEPGRTEILTNIQWLYPTLLARTGACSRFKPRLS
jgi:hypothetical protein